MERFHVLQKECLLFSKKEPNPYIIYPSWGVTWWTVMSGPQCLYVNH